MEDASGGILAKTNINTHWLWCDYLPQNLVSVLATSGLNWIPSSFEIIMLRQL